MTDRETCLATLAACKASGDTGAHSMADAALCDLLVSLGYQDVVAAFHEVDKWYA